MRHSRPAGAAIALAFFALLELSGCGSVTKPKAVPVGDPPAQVEVDPMEQFAAAVDRACAFTYNRSQARESALRSAAQAADASSADSGTSVLGIWAANQSDLHRLTGELGEPPAKARLFGRWRANVARRGQLFARSADAWSNGNRELNDRLQLRIDAGKLEANRLGTRFGLRVCTSNGPVLDQDPEARADAERIYLEQIERVCRQRNQLAWKLWSDDALTPNAAVGIRVSETERIAALGPGHIDLFELRDRILTLKRNLNAEGRRMLQAPTDASFDARRERFGRHAYEVGDRLERVGLPACNTRS